MSIDEYVDEVRNGLRSKMEELCRLLKTNMRTGSLSPDQLRKQTTGSINHREELLVRVIRRAADELEKTKRSFKSKRVKEVREMLLESIKR